MTVAYAEQDYSYTVLVGVRTANTCACDDANRK